MLLQPYITRGAQKAGWEVVVDSSQPDNILVHRGRVQIVIELDMTKRVAFHYNIRSDEHFDNDIDRAVWLTIDHDAYQILKHTNPEAPVFPIYLGDTPKIAVSTDDYPIAADRFIYKLLLGDFQYRKTGQGSRYRWIDINPNR